MFSPENANFANFFFEVIKLEKVYVSQNLALYRRFLKSRCTNFKKLKNIRLVDRANQLFRIGIKVRNFLSMFFKVNTKTGLPKDLSKNAARTNTPQKIKKNIFQ